MPPSEPVETVRFSRVNERTRFIQSPSRELNLRTSSHPVPRSVGECCCTRYAHLQSRDRDVVPTQRRIHVLEDVPRVHGAQPSAVATANVHFGGGGGRNRGRRAVLSLHPALPFSRGQGGRLDGRMKSRVGEGVVGSSVLQATITHPPPCRRQHTQDGTARFSSPARRSRERRHGRTLARGEESENLGSSTACCCSQVS